MTHARRRLVGPAGVLFALFASSLAACSGSAKTVEVAKVAPPPPVLAAEPVDTSADAGTAKDTAPGREDRLIAKMMKRVAEARGVPATRAVPGVTLTREGLIARVRAHVAEEIPTEAIRAEGLTLQLLGVIPTEFDYLGSTFALLEAQLAGFYEPSNGSMYLAADLEGDLAEATLAHELVHALQDQKWGLGPQTKYKPGESDKSAAVHALAEGDATSAMTDVLIAKTAKGHTALDLPDNVLSDGMLESIEQGPAAKTPHVMQTSLVSPYIEGTRFVHALRRQGGWAAVNAAWDHPPETTEQLLHAEKFLAHEPALAIADPVVAPLGAGYKTLDVDTAGELGLRLIYAEWIGNDAANEAAAGWGGDRVILVEKGDTSALALHVRYDAQPAKPGGAARAKTAFAVLANGLKKSLKGAGSITDGGTFFCAERASLGLGPMALTVKGADLVLVAGPTKVGPKGSWASASTCAQAKTWAKAVSEQK